MEAAASLGSESYTEDNIATNDTFLSHINL